MSAAQVRQAISKLFPSKIKQNLFFKKKKKILNNIIVFNQVEHNFELYKKI
jgi:hypothetical protein